METICMKCQILFSEKNKKDINLSSAEYVHRVLKVNRLISHKNIITSKAQANLVAAVCKAIKGISSFLRRACTHKIFSLFLHENVCCGYLLEAPEWGTSNEYPQHVFTEK